MKKNILILLFTFFIVNNLIGQQYLYLKFDSNMNNQFTTGWQMSPYTNTTYTSFSYDTDAYGPIGSIDFHCPDKNIWVEELPIAQLANYNVRTIENIELELQNLTTQQKWAFFENFKRYFIIEIQPNGQTFHLISVYISGQKSLGTWQIRK